MSEVVLFWGVFAAWLILLGVMVKTEYSIPAILSSVAYLLLLQFAFHVNVLDMLLHHWFLVLVGVGIYFVAGTAWSFFRWFVFARDKLGEYFKMRDDWLESKGQTDFKFIPDQLKEEWTKYLEQPGYNRKDMAKPPLVRRNKSRIMGWISFWPISLGLFLLEDLVKRIAKSIYGQIHDALQSVANRVFASVKKDMPENFKNV